MTDQRRDWVPVWAGLFAGGVLLLFVASAQTKGSTRPRARVALGQIKSLTTALEAYRADVGRYPADPGGVFGADIPHFLFAGLHMKEGLGGGPNGPYYDADNSAIGILKGLRDFRASPDGAGGSVPLNFIEESEVRPRAEPLGEAVRYEDLASEVFQNRFDYGAAPAAVHLDGVAGYPVFLDPWGNPYHYREWASKVDAGRKAAWRGAGPPVDLRCHHPEAFDLWSCGPDGVNDYGRPGSDDVTSWRR